MTVYFSSTNSDFDRFEVVEAVLMKRSAMFFQMIKFVYQAVLRPSGP